jgi:hypothetical protein
MVHWYDLGAIFNIAAILTISSFALFLPLNKLFGKKLALKFTIPISLSLQIIFGYAFYCLGITKYYPITYALLMLGINIWSVWHIKLNKIFENIFKSQNIIVCLILIFFFCVIAYNRFFDSLTTIAPGEIDTYNHLVFLKDLVRDGFLSFPQYAPGFHLFIFPLTFFAKTSEIYRFAGPAIGVITSISLFLLLKDSFISRYSKYILLLILCLPIFNQLFLQEIGFFSTSLSFILFPVLIFIIASNKNIDRKISYIFFSIIITALSLTLPYLYIQYLPALAALILITLLFKRYIESSYIKHLFIILTISIIGFVIAFGHVYLQTKVLKRATSFPGMELTYIENGEIITTDNYRLNASSNSSTNAASLNSDSVLNTAQAKIADTLGDLKENEIFVHYINPMFNIAYNAFMVKNIRVPSDIVSLGAYLWIFLSAILIPISLKRKSFILYTISVFSVVFGISTQFGILEISTYRGRSGWYLMFLTSIGLAFIIDHIIAKRIDGNKFIPPIILAFAITGIIKPPVYYRPYYIKPYEIVRDIIKDFPQSSIDIMTRDKHIGALSDRISTNILTDDAAKIPCNKNICLIIIEKHLMAIDPVLSQQASAIDKNFQVFAKQQNNMESSNMALTEKIRIMPEFKSYELYWDDSNVEIYKYKGL